MKNSILDNHLNKLNRQEEQRKLLAIQLAFKSGIVAKDSEKVL